MQPTDPYRAGKRLWSTADDALICACYPHEHNDVLARALRRSIQAVYARADKLKLRKSAAYLASPHACRLRRGDNVGARFRFSKGHVPANKGMRRPGWGPGRMKETQFQLGQLSGHAARHVMPVGSTRLIEGYVYRKVSAVPNVPYTVNWKAEHVLLWARERGPVPAGHVIGFRNGDKSDIQIGNLVCIPRRELMARNSLHNLPKPLAHTIQMLGALRRQIGKREKPCQRKTK